jgi:hypothetical protein
MNRNIIYLFIFLNSCISTSFINNLLAQTLDYKISTNSFTGYSPGKIILNEAGTTYFLTSDGTVLNSVSMDGKVKAVKVKFPKSAEGAKEKSASFVTFNNKMYALVDGINKVNETRDFYAIEFDKTTLLATSEPKKIASIEKTKTGLFSGQMYSYAISSDQKKMAVLVRGNLKEKLVVFRYFLLDQDLKNIETFDLDRALCDAFYSYRDFNPAYGLYNTSILDNLSRMYLTNQGELVFAISGSKDKNLRLAIADGKTIKYIDVSNNKNLNNLFSQRIGNTLFVKSNIMDSEGQSEGLYLAKFNLETKKTEFEYNEKYSSECKTYYHDKMITPDVGFDKTATVGILQSESGRIYIFDQKAWTERVSMRNPNTNQKQTLITFNTGPMWITCIEKDGKLIYREKLLKRGISNKYDILAFIPICEGDRIHILFHDSESNITSSPTGEIQPGNDEILSDAIFDNNGKQKRVNTNIYDQKLRLFIRTDLSTFVNQGSALLMLFNSSKDEGKFVEITIK